MIALLSFGCACTTVLQLPPCAAVECFFKTCGTNSHCETSALTSQATNQAVCVCDDGFKEDRISKSCVGEAEFCVEFRHVTCYAIITLCYSNVQSIYNIYTIYNL